MSSANLAFLSEAQSRHQKEASISSFLSTHSQLRSILLLLIKCETIELQL